MSRPKAAAKKREVRPPAPRSVEAVVADIIEEVRRDGDAALRKLTRELDGVELDSPAVGESEWQAAVAAVSPPLVADLRSAIRLIRRFARRQLKAYRDFELEVEPGVITGQRVSPVRRVGIYVPGGRFPLFSSLLMAAVPAAAAGVEETIVCTPPGRDGRVAPAVLAAARLCGVGRVFKVGGAQAIAAMAFGTAAIPRADKIVGPGNVYVNAAKRQVYGLVGVDFIAGPTEIMVIADGGANADFIAADLIAQAEHDPRATARLVTDSAALAARVLREIKKRLRDPKTAEAAGRLLANPDLVIKVGNIEEAVGLANDAAPEHLEICVAAPDKLAAGLRAFGSLAMGELASPVLEDYASGLNHILPTNSAARYTGGLGVRDFLKIQTTLRVSETGLRRIGPLARRLAEAEGLAAHADAVVRRLKSRGIE